MFIQAYKKQMKTYAIEQQKLKKMEMIQSMKVVPSDEENLQREGDGKRTSSRWPSSGPNQGPTEAKDEEAVKKAKEKKFSETMLDIENEDFTPTYT